MATTRASNAEAFYLAQTQGSRVGTARGDEANAGLTVITTTITLDGDEVTGGVVKLTSPLRQGQIIVPALSKVVTESATATGALDVDIGTADDPDLIASGLDLANAGVLDLGSKYTDLESFNTGDEIIATLADVDTPVAGAKLTFYLVSRSV